MTHTLAGIISLLSLTVTALAVNPNPESIPEAKPAGVGAAKPAGVNAILASVDGEPVFLADILPQTRAQEYRAYAANSGKALEEKIKQIRTRAVNDQIDRKLVLADYRAHTFKIPEGTIEQRLDEYAEGMGCRSRPEFIATLRKEGTSLEEIKKVVTEQVTVEIMLYRQIQVGVNLTPREVYEYFLAHREKFVTPEKIELALLLLDPQTPSVEIEKRVREIRDTLAESPERFGELAARWSVGPNAAAGGSLGLIERSRIRPEFAAAMTDPAPGKIYGPVKTADGPAFLRVLRREAPGNDPFHRIAPQVRRELEAERRQKLIETYLDGLRAKALIRYFF